MRRIRIPFGKKPATSVGLAAACLLYLTLGLSHVFMLKPYQPGDERRHVKYVVVLETKSRLPKMRETRAANHPPAYYELLATTTMHGIESSDKAKDRVFASRLFSVAFGLTALVYSFCLLRLLLPGLPGVAVHAATLMAVLPSYANSTAMIGNDAMSVAAQCAMAYGAVSTLLSGPTLLGCLHLGAWMCLGALTRVSVVALLPVSLVAVFAGALWHFRGSRARKIGLGALVSGGLLLAVVASSGWFYVFNQMNLGGVSGADAVLATKRSHPVRPLLEVVFSPKVWLEMVDELWGRFSGSIQLKGALRRLVRVLTSLSVAGAAFALFRAKVWRGLRKQPTPRLFSWIVIAGFYVSVVLPTLYYHSKGGGLHQRYLFGALYIITLVLALAVTWTKNRLVMLFGVCTLFLLAFAEHLTYAARLARRVKTFPITDAMKRAHVPGALDLGVWFMLLVALGFAGFIYAMLDLHKPLRPEASSDV